MNRLPVLRFEKKAGPFKVQAIVPIDIHLLAILADPSVLIISRFNDLVVNCL